MGIPGSIRKSVAQATIYGDFLCRIFAILRSDFVIFWAHCVSGGLIWSYTTLDSKGFFDGLCSVDRKISQSLLENSSRIGLLAVGIGQFDKAYSYSLIWCLFEKLLADGIHSKIRVHIVVIWFSIIRRELKVVKVVAIRLDIVLPSIFNFWHRVPCVRNAIELQAKEKQTAPCL